MAPKRTSARLSMLASTGRRMDKSESFIVSAPRHLVRQSGDQAVQLSMMFVVRETPESTAGCTSEPTLRTDLAQDSSCDTMGLSNALHSQNLKPNDASKTLESPAGPSSLFGAPAAEVPAHIQRHRADGRSSRR